MNQRLKSYDALDRAEILSALLHVGKMLGKEDLTTAKTLRTALQLLPQAVTSQIALLELPV